MTKFLLGLAVALAAFAPSASASDPCERELCTEKKLPATQLAGDPAVKPAKSRKGDSAAASVSPTALVGAWYYAWTGGYGGWTSLKITSVAPLAGELEAVYWVNLGPRNWESRKIKGPLATGNEPKGAQTAKAWLQDGRLYVEMPSGSRYNDCVVHGEKLACSFVSAVNPGGSRNVEFSRQ